MEVEVSDLAALLRETAERHHPYEQSAAEHDWSEWYAAYLHARQHGSTTEAAADAAAAHVDAVR